MIGRVFEVGPRVAGLRRDTAVFRNGDLDGDLDLLSAGTGGVQKSAKSNNQSTFVAVVADVIVIVIIIISILIGSKLGRDWVGEWVRHCRQIG